MATQPPPTPPAPSWWSGLERSRKIVIAALALSFVSQFLRYKTDTSGGMLSREMDTDYYTGITLWGSTGGTGWQVHPIVVPMLIALAAIYLTDFHRRPFWNRRGHWIAIGMFFFCTAPADIVATLGGFLGGVVMVLAVWSALIHRKAAQAGTPPPA
ncbi:hypothetical protein [uncultured Sphingomonas sp.]|uniref:hypothetical protein n=1 Tax=uncultured Sphingomonas sp. TaxID=158754 RepID=UPI0035CBA65D